MDPMLQVVNVLHAWFNVLTFESERGGWLWWCVCPEIESQGTRAVALGLRVGSRDSRAKTATETCLQLREGVMFCKIRALLIFSSLRHGLHDVSSGFVPPHSFKDSKLRLQKCPSS